MHKRILTLLLALALALTALSAWAQEDEAKEFTVASTTQLNGDFMGPYFGNNAADVDVRVMLPSCVPATPLDEAGAALNYRAIDSFYEHGRVEGLAEMMNFVGVVGADEQVLQKIVAAQPPDLSVSQ